LLTLRYQLEQSREQGTMSKPQIDVAIAILLHQDKVLVGWREAKQHQGNKHEFPGGKVEQGESPEQAVVVKFLKRLELVYMTGMLLILFNMNMMMSL
jgi:ADP-ribose pyrophosphatase